MTHENIQHDFQYRGPGRPPGAKNRPKVEPVDCSSGVATEELRQFVERIERLEEEKKALADDIKDVFAELTGRGFDRKAVRTLIRLRREDPAERQEAQAILELYASAIGLAL